MFKMKRLERALEYPPPCKGSQGASSAQMGSAQMYGKGELLNLLMCCGQLGGLHGSHWRIGTVRPGVKAGWCLFKNCLR